MAGTLLVLVISCGVGQLREPPPLTAEQRQKIGKLAADTQREAVRLKAQLESRQRDLTRLYAEYDLDEEAAKAIERDILDVQQRMLANYRNMQTELRSLVDEERFIILKKRLDRMLQVVEKPKVEKSAPSKQ